MVSIRKRNDSSGSLRTIQRMIFNVYDMMAAHKYGWWSLAYLWMTPAINSFPLCSPLINPSPFFLLLYFFLREGKYDVLFRWSIKKTNVLQAGRTSRAIPLTAQGCVQHHDHGFTALLLCACLQSLIWCNGKRLWECKPANGTENKTVPLCACLSLPPSLFNTPVVSSRHHMIVKMI